MQKYICTRTRVEGTQIIAARPPRGASERALTVTLLRVNYIRAFVCAAAADGNSDARVSMLARRWLRQRSAR